MYLCICVYIVGCRGASQLGGGSLLGIPPGYKGDKKDNNFVNESQLFTLGKTIATTYTTTARELSIYGLFGTRCMYALDVCYKYV